MFLTRDLLAVLNTRSSKIEILCICGVCTSMVVEYSYQRNYLVEVDRTRNPSQNPSVR
jgi:hypothetical protein